MNRKEALEYNDSLKKQLGQAALLYGLEQSAGTYIVDHFITVLPEDARKGLIFLGESSGSYKAGNIKIDLKKAIIAGLEFAASINKPESIFNYIQLIIVSAFLVAKSTKQKLSRLEAYIVYLLHKKGAYDISIVEEHFVDEVQEWYKQKERKPVEREEVIEAIITLYKINTLDFSDGYIYLKEHVWGKIK